MNASVLSTCVAVVNFRLFVDSQAHVFMHGIQMSTVYFYMEPKRQ